MTEGLNSCKQDMGPGKENRKGEKKNLQMGGLCV